MGIDDWLIETQPVAILRVYAWEPDWGSYGYFVPDAEAAAALPGLQRVRRRTGGGIVDHRHDWTYTVSLPIAEAWARARGGASYRFIHGALAQAMRAGGAGVTLASGTGAARGGECFVQPVEHDVLGQSGMKVAGAGQRRTAAGLLHQGSVQARVDADLAARLAGGLAQEVEPLIARPGVEEIARRAGRYRDAAWRQRR